MTRLSQQGFTLIEMLVSLVLGAILIAGLDGVIGQVLNTHDIVSEKNKLTRDGRFAMEQMTRVVSQSRLLMLPLADKPLSNWRENVREETVPASPPEGSSSKATAVLAVTLPLFSDLDSDGFPDADDDRDGRIDEDSKGDRADSQASGIHLIDDDGDGQVDEASVNSDDESSTVNDDPINGVDDDDDDNVDEDPSSDMNGDGCPGICGVDEDGDGQIDEASVNDDDEDGQVDEDSLNPVVFYLDNDSLMQRTPVPWDENSSGSVTGQDLIAQSIADNVTRFRVERVPSNGGGVQLVDLTLELTSQITGETVSLHSQVRIGGAL